MTRGWRLAGALLPLVLAACATPHGTRTPGPLVHVPTPPPVPAQPARKVSPYAPAQEDPSKRGDYVAGGLFRPGEPDTVPADIPDVDAIPEPEVRAEPRAATGNRDYVVLGKRYRVLDSEHGYVEEGLASYYGTKFHRRRTSSGEVYDMYAFTGAHRSLPLPSFARVTNLDNGKSVIVRINDRGPFHSDRLIDLSYAAAVKLGYRERGTARVRVEALVPEDAPPADAAPSGLDRWVAQAGPAAATGPAASAAGDPPVPAPASAQAAARFEARAPDGQARSADEFEAWMRARGIRVARGRPADPAPTPVAATAPAAQAAAAAEAGVVLQVASYASEDAARQAQQRLAQAAIAGASVRDAELGGRRLWRLRIGPVPEAQVAELRARLAGLGFGPPLRVRE
ncbi:septal ring lytic transglycosylase RlpA family protein [Thermomonas flagellata]|uniref:septal ring lytic transglycosylase RlpA family protein n=1 Tax=Thermomonas flagellata TaxID=2888524 RepID=UPI001F0398CC|nr:septal ring lytic transglycosylase RlpA family protein [Thermomonas flagellata]